MVNPSKLQGTDADIGRKLRLIREANGLSQRDMAKKCGITHSNISMIEQGQVSPSIASLSKILSAIPMSLAHFFNCNVTDKADVFLTNETFISQDTHFGALQLLPESLGLRGIDFKKLIVAPNGDTGTKATIAAVDQVFWITSGALEVTIGEKVAMLNADQGFYIQAYCYYRFKNLSETEAVTMVMASQLMTSL